MCVAVWTFSAFAADPAMVDPVEKSVYAAVKVARELAASKNVYDQILGAGALVEVGDRPALELLEGYVNSSDKVLKRSAIDTLISAVHPNSTDLLYRMAAADHDTLSLLIESLASVPREDMGDLLVEALRIPNEYVQKHALQALVRIDVNGRDKEIREVIGDPHSDNIIKAYGYYVLVSTGHGEELFAKLQEITDSGDLSAQEVIAVALGLINTPASKTALGKLSKSTEERVALAAIASNAGLGDDKAISQLIHLIAYGKPMQAAVAAGALKRLPGDMALQITTTLLQCCKLSADAGTRLLESWAWVESDPEIVYKWGLANPEADIRLQTIWMMGERKDKTAIARLTQFLSDEDPALRGMAAWAIIHTVGDRYTPGVET